MKTTLIAFLIMSSGLSLAGPLEDARRDMLPKKNLPSPSALDTRILGKMSAKIYRCVNKDVIPCKAVQGDIHYQIGVVSAYLERLREEMPKARQEQTIAQRLLLELSRSEEARTIEDICAMAPWRFECS